jgi:LacI family gluconate utilization system Gnt-I transcriptional repressor
MAETKTPQKRSRAGRAATVVDVARLARVAANTVSRVLNHPEQVADETRERVLEAIRVTGYVPNLLAAGVRSARSQLIAAVVPTVSGPMFLDTIQGLTETLEQKGYQLILGQAGYDGAREDELLNAIIGRRPAGIALIGIAHTQDSRRRLMASGIPIVETWDLTPTPIDMVVGFPHEEIGAAVCEFILGKGRRRPAVVSGRDERAARRTAAFQTAARKGGFDVPVEWTAAPGTFEGGRAAAAQLLDHRSPPGRGLVQLRPSGAGRGRRSQLARDASPAGPRRRGVRQPGFLGGGDPAAHDSPGGRAPDRAAGGRHAGGSGRGAGSRRALRGRRLLDTRARQHLTSRVGQWAA